MTSLSGHKQANMATRRLLAEIYCDLNGQVRDRGYSLELPGSVDSFAKLGLALEAVVGKQFSFYMGDMNERNEPDDLMFDGIVVSDPQLGYFALAEGDFYWRSERRD